jgi:type I site-specific restriction-modification system R (restriction) subunit
VPTVRAACRVAKHARDPKDPLKLVIVRDMWLTGFYAPCMHTMYVDKPMQGHGLMQAIARVNRVFRDKPAGLIVDYIGIAQNLNAITTAEVLQELIQIAKDIRAARARGEEQGLSEDEIAFYDALAENDSAVQMMGDDKLKLIAHELLMSLRENVTVDWAHRDSARARMRVLVKRILRKYGYPPDLQDAAVQTVLQQAEALSSTWFS